MRPDECLVIEDSLAGIASAKGAGMWAVGIAHTYEPAELRSAGADAVLAVLEDLTPAWIERTFFAFAGRGAMAMAMDEPVATPGGEGPAGLLLSRDLIFTSKITGTARALGHRVMTAGNAALASTLIEQWHPRVVFVDLAAGDLVSPAALASYRKSAGPATRFLAFGSHVDTRAARRRGRRRLRPRAPPQPVLGRAPRPDPPLPGRAGHVPLVSGRVRRAGPVGRGTRR